MNCEDEAEDKFAAVLAQRGLPLPSKSQYHIELPRGSFTVADCTYPEEKVLVYIDGISVPLCP
jgi:hypothetical protein